nr:tetratricopeptide repeat protein [uncultured Duganella sp.]
MYTDPQQAYLDGNRRMAVGDAVGAEECFWQAIALQPEHAGARANLGYVKELRGQLLEAEFHYLHAIALLPDSPQLYLNLGVLLQKARRFDESEAAARMALELAPESPSAWSQLGVALACVKREREAEECYRRALEIDEDYSRAQFNLAYILLRQGRFADGWPLLESRWHFDSLAQPFNCPPWEGQPLAGKSVVIVSEAGQGDMIHFCRYAALLKDAGAARVAVACPPGLRRLMAGLSGVDEVYVQQGALPASGWDFWTHPMRLPALFGTDLASIPSSTPYISVDPEAVRYWGGMVPGQGLRVGLAWKGNPLFENDAERSLPSLHTLAPLAGAGGLHFVSLQKGDSEDEALTPPAGMALQALAPRLQDFADTAGVIANLDLVISVDTAVAHLAGALGKPVWLLLPDHRCDWRWMAERGDTPWYPSMRLFRQPPGGGWAAVVAEVVSALRVLAGAHPAKR